MKKIFLFLLITITSVSCQQKDTQGETEQSHTNPIKKEVQQSSKPIDKACTKEAKICPDGSSVGRDPKNNCEFSPCPRKASTPKVSKPIAKICTADVKECPDESYVGRDHYNNCKFKECPNTGFSKKSLN